MGSFRVNASQHGANTVYMTPSVRYAAHPLYSRIYKTDGHYFHIVPRAVNKPLTNFKGKNDAALSTNPRSTPSSKDNKIIVVQTGGFIAEVEIDRLICA